MIGQALSVIREELNNYLQKIDRRMEDWVILSNIVNPDGSIPDQTLGKVTISVANIQKDVVLKSLGYINENKPKDNNYVILNLHILVSANFKDYRTTLDSLSHVVTFFHEKNVFDHLSSPSLPASIDKLTLEMENLNTEQLNNTWSAMGAKYTPSVVYKIKMTVMK